MADVCPVYSSTALNLLKADLGYFDSKIPDAIESSLMDLLAVAEQKLRTACNISLVEDDLADTYLQVMYAAWLYRNRATGAGKTEALKDAIRNRQVGNALHDASGGTEAVV